MSIIFSKLKQPLDSYVCPYHVRKIIDGIATASLLAVTTASHDKVEFMKRTFMV